MRARTHAVQGLQAGHLVAGPQPAHPQLSGQLPMQLHGRMAHALPGHFPGQLPAAMPGALPGQYTGVQPALPPATPLQGSLLLQQTGLMLQGRAGVWTGAPRPSPAAAAGGLCMACVHHQDTAMQGSGAATARLCRRFPPGLHVLMSQSGAQGLQAPGGSPLGMPGMHSMPSQVRTPPPPQACPWAKQGPHHPAEPLPQRRPSLRWPHPCMQGCAAAAGACIAQASDATCTAPALPGVGLELTPPQASLPARTQRSRSQRTQGRQL